MGGGAHHLSDSGAACGRRTERPGHYSHLVTAVTAPLHLAKDLALWVDHSRIVGAIGALVAFLIKG